MAFRWRADEGPTFNAGVVPVDYRQVNKAAGLLLLTTYGQYLYLWPVAYDNLPCVKPRGATPIANQRPLIYPTSQGTRRALSQYFRKVRAISQHWLGSCVNFYGIWTSIARKPYIFVFFRGSGPPVSPSGSAHVVLITTKLIRRR